MNKQNDQDKRLTFLQQIFLVLLVHRKLSLLKKEVPQIVEDLCYQLR